MTRNFSLLVVLFLVVGVAACSGPPPNVAAVEGHAVELSKSVHTVQADESGAVEFQVPDHDPAGGLPMVQTYEAPAVKYSHVLLYHVPHVLDGRGMVYVETEPLGWVVVVVIR